MKTKFTAFLLATLLSFSSFAFSEFSTDTPKGKFSKKITIGKLNKLIKKERANPIHEEELREKILKSVKKNLRKEKKLIKKILKRKERSGGRAYLEKKIVKLAMLNPAYYELKGQLGSEDVYEKIEDIFARRSGDEIVEQAMGEIQEAGGYLYFLEAQRKILNQPSSNHSSWSFLDTMSLGLLFLPGAAYTTVSTAMGVGLIAIFVIWSVSE